MSDVFYLRPIVPPIAPDDVQQMAQHAGGCFDLHRVDWVQSYLAADGARMLCWYQAPDAESVRIALRQLGSDMQAVWPGIVSGEEPRGMQGDGERCVVVELSFDGSLDETRLEQARNAVASVLADRGLSLLRAFTSNDGARIVYIVQGQDSSAVEDAIRNANLGPSRLWSGSSLTPRLPGR